MISEATEYWHRAETALATARALLSIDHDAAASRAYYAAFFAVSALFAKDGRSFGKHSAVQAAVHRDLVHTGRFTEELGAAYSALGSLRLLGDYGGATHVDGTAAIEAVAAAARILDAVRPALTGT